MGFRFRKSIKLMPGVRVNLSKTGASVSLGGRGAPTNISRRGVRSTVGIPGSGLSYTTRTTPWRRRTTARPLPSSQPVMDSFGHRRVSLLLGLGILFIPYIFAWFTLRQGYSRQARLISFFWLAMYILPIAMR